MQLHIFSVTEKIIARTHLTQEEMMRAVGILEGQGYGGKYSAVAFMLETS